MKKLLKRFKTTYVSVETGKKCSKLNWFRYHSALLSIPGLLMFLVLPPVGGILLCMAMFSILLTCPIRLLTSMVRVFKKLGVPMLETDSAFSDGVASMALAILLPLLFLFLVGWVMCIFNLFVCPWRFTLKKFDEKFIPLEDYENSRKAETFEGDFSEINEAVLV